MENVTVVQTVEAELSTQIFLWGKHQCHQDSDFVNPYRQFADHNAAKENQAHMELLRHGDHGQHNADVLRELLHLL